MTRSLRDWADLMYMPLGEVHHIVPFGGERAMCGLDPAWYGWFGTGSWHERALADRLPRCTECHIRVLALPSADDLRLLA